MCCIPNILFLHPGIILSRLEVCTASTINCVAQSDYKITVFWSCMLVMTYICNKKSTCRVNPEIGKFSRTFINYQKQYYVLCIECKLSIYQNWYVSVNPQSAFKALGEPLNYVWSSIWFSSKQITRFICIFYNPFAPRAKLHFS